MRTLSGVVAASRFGMGAASGELDRIGRDGREWVLAQLVPGAPPPSLAALPPTAELAARFEAIRAEQRVAAERQTALPAAGNVPVVEEPGRQEIRRFYLAEAAARTRVAADGATPVAERFVQFWSNHFTVSISRPVVAPLAGAFEREAIRPNVFGSFHQLLRAAVGHPAMLLYLDNVQSLGPDSVAGQRRGKGLNENLARELLELHTLGVDGGYGQGDVEQLARILTGWTIGRQADGTAGQFAFQPRFHQPGEKTLLGRRFPEAGQAEGEEALLMLAGHPATARFIAGQLVRHFVADDPPPAAVEAVAKVFRDTDGELGQVAAAVASRPEAWAHPLVKLRSPNDFVVAVLRALGGPSFEDRQLVGVLGLLGQAPWAAPSPAGWPDRAEAWIGPEALMRRIEWARNLGRRLPGLDVSALAEAIFGPAVSAATRQAIAGAADGAEALLLLLASREFQRR